MKAKFLVTFITALVLCSLIVAHADSSAITLNKQSYTVGETVTASFDNAIGDANAWLAIYPSGSDPYESYPATSKVWKYANSDTETAGSAPLAAGTVTFSTGGLTPGEYRCSYFIDNGYQVDNTITFSITEAGTNPQTDDGFVLLPMVLIITTGLILLKRKEIKAA